MSNTFNPGDSVSFSLGGIHFGSGDVVAQGSNALVVKLDAECKDFHAGDQIRVLFSEIIDS